MAQLMDKSQYMNRFKDLRSAVEDVFFNKDDDATDRLIDISKKFSKTLKTKNYKKMERI